MIFKDPSQPLEERVKDLLQQLTLEEKVGQLVMRNDPIERLGIGFFHWWNEALHGFAQAGEATVFPQAIALAATWDPQCLHRVGEISSLEGRAINNEELKEQGGNSRARRGLTIWSPNINIFRDPRWGRGQETYGEDPFLTAMMGNAFVKGLQGDDSQYLRSVATLKHYAVHSGPEPLRHEFDATCSEKDLRDTYLPAFEDGVKVGSARSVMSAYNAFDGEPCVVSKRLLEDILRKEWGFEGAVVGDVDNVHDLYREGAHGYCETGAEAMAQAIQAGNDLRSGGDAHHALEAVEKGLLNEEEIDLALKRLLTLRFKLGHFDPPEQLPWKDLNRTIIRSEEHVQANYEICRDALVLLKNDGVLPLKAKELKRVAVIGPCADNLEVLKGNYCGDPYAPVTILEGLKEKLEPRGVEVVEELDIPFAYGHSEKGKPIPPGVFFADPEGKVRGLRCRMFNDREAQGEPVIDQVVEQPALEWNTALPRPAELTEASSCVEWTGFMKLEESGSYQFHTKIRGRSVLEIEGCEPSHSYIKLGIRQLAPVVFDLEGGQLVPIRIFWQQEADEGFFSISWDPADGGASVEKAFERALNTAKTSDLVILSLGLSSKLEGEEMQNSPEGFDRGDRTTISLPTPQRRLLKEIHSLGKPVVLLLSSGSALAFDPDQAGAILQSWYSGAQGGRAIADALLGENSPAGRLPVTFYRSDDDLPDFSDYSMKNRTYRFFEGEALYPFGHGLSYTKFEYGPEIKAQHRGEGVELRFAIENIGSLKSDEVVQVYASRSTPEAGDPQQWLVGFERVRNMRPGERRDLAILCPKRWLSLWSDAEGKRSMGKGDLLLKVGGSSKKCPLSLSIKTESFH